MSGRLLLIQSASLPIADGKLLPIAAARLHSTIVPLVVVSALAAIAFFHHLGSSPLNDWDEAWHAEVSREILTTGDWLTLHYRGDLYFNKPPLTFWFRAVAFRAFGVHEWTARLGSACFSWASVIAITWFALRRFNPLAGVFAGLILSCSWLFTTYHAGRSGETDGTLVFFNTLTLIALWYAARRSRWFYAAGLFTALAWMTKGGTAYLPWLAAVGVTLVDRTQTRWRWRHAAGGLALGFLLAAPWQIAMLAKHGRAFFNAFYVHEAMEPTFGVSEGHGGDWAFHLSVLRLFFQPWLSLAGAGAISIILRGKALSPASRWIVAWAIVMLGGCSLIPTKLIWYAAPALPPLAILAGIAISELTRRRGGFFILIAAAVIAIAHFAYPSWLAPHVAWGIALTLMGGAFLIIAPPARFRFAAALGVICALVPVTLDRITLFRVLARDQNPEEWLDRREADEPWREFAQVLAKESSHDRVLLVDFPASPAAEFYIRQAVGDRRVEEAIGADAIKATGKIAIMRIESVPIFQTSGWKLLFADQGLAAMTFKNP